MRLGKTESPHRSSNQNFPITDHLTHRQTVLNCFGQQGNDVWPEECLVRARYLYSIILRSQDNFEKADELENEAKSQLKRLLPASWPQLLRVDPGTSLESVDNFVLCDLVVPSPAGRFMTYNWKGDGS